MTTRRNGLSKRRQSAKCARRFPASSPRVPTSNVIPERAAFSWKRSNSAGLKTGQREIVTELRDRDSEAHRFVQESNASIGRRGG